MNKLATILFVLGVLSALFGYWGMSTEAGRRHFDEMAGMIPFGACVAGGLFTLTALILVLIAFLRHR